MEVKLRKSTRLSKGQKSAKAHVENGDDQFEVRSKKVKVKADRLRPTLELHVFTKP